MNPVISFAQSNQPNNALKTLNTGTAIVQIMSVTVNNKKQNILATLNGLALYYLEGQNASKPLCGNTGNPVCNQDWPPLLFTGSETPPSPDGVTLNVQKNVNGQQVEVNSDLLYTYSDDAQDPKHAIHGNGETLSGHKWLLAIVSGNSPITQQSLKDIQYRIEENKTLIKQLRHQMDVVEFNMSKDIQTLDVHDFDVKKFEDCVKDHPVSQC